jgi:fluoride exporter
MSAALVLAVGIVGGLGAIGRFVLDAAVTERVGRRFPYGTLAVNLSGSLVLGALFGAAVSGDSYDVIGTGLLGAYTTLSTWALESHRLGEDGQLPTAALNVALSLALGLAAAWAGRHLGAVL